MTESLLNRYRRFRWAGNRPAHALRLARETAPASAYAIFTGFERGNDVSPESDGLRWVERCRINGLRLVGHSDELRQSIRHKGWYVDDMQEDVFRGVVYALPSRKGERLLVAGYADPWNKDAARLNFRTLYNDEAAAALAADRIAEREAEEAREFYQRQNEEAEREELEAADEELADEFWDGEVYATA